MTKYSQIKLDDEMGRLAAIRRYGVYDEASQHWFDDIVALVKAIFSVPYAAITIVDQEQLWTKATAGSAAAVLPREGMFCEYTIGQEHAFSVADTSQDIRFSEAPHVTSNGHVQCYFGAPLTTPDGYNLGAICIFGVEPRTFTEGERLILENFAKVVVAQFELRQAAGQDSLTGAMSRRAFHDRLAQCIAANEQAALLMIDIDHFKSINDTYGHPAGDETLRAVAEGLRGENPRLGCLGRLGGEEFAILLRHTGLDEAVQVAERLLQAVANIRISVIGEKPVTISIGIAEVGSFPTIDAWLAKADQALYHAKRSGRNRAVALI